MELTELEENAIQDRLEGWELVEFLQVPIELVLQVAMENDWIDDENVEDVQEFIGLKE